jgi:hypothetical protein
LGFGRYSIRPHSIVGKRSKTSLTQY